MTEEQWLACTDPTPMLVFLRDGGQLSERKVRLYAVACCRRIWPLLTDERSRRAVEVAEHLADGGASQEEVADAWNNAEEVYEEDSYVSAAYAAASYLLSRDALATCDAAAEAMYDAADVSAESAEADERAAQAALLRELFGPLPFRPVAVEDGWLIWNAGTVRRLAEAAYQERLLPQGTLDPGRLAVLADALEESGCADAELLGHLRGPGPHVPGCWCVDLLLGKS